MRMRIAHGINSYDIIPVFKNRREKQEEARLVMEFSLRAEETTLTEAERSYYQPQGQSFVQYLTSRGKEVEERTEGQNKNTRIGRIAQKLQVSVTPPPPTHTHTHTQNTGMYNMVAS